MRLSTNRDRLRRQLMRPPRWGHVSDIIIVVTFFGVLALSILFYFFNPGH